MNSRCRNPQLHVLHRPGKEGLGRAYCAGFAWALERAYEFVFEMDGELSHNPDDIPRFLQAAANADLVLGTRYARRDPRDQLAPQPPAPESQRGQVRANDHGNALFRPDGGLQVLSRTALQAIDLQNVHSNGYSFQIELTHKIWRQGLRIAEVPIMFTDRFQGTSKMSPHIVREALGMVWRLWLQNGLRRQASGSAVGIAGSGIPRPAHHQVVAGSGMPGEDADRASCRRQGHLLRSSPRFGRVGERTAPRSGHESEVLGGLWAVKGAVLLDTGPLVVFLAAGLEHHEWVCEQWRRLPPPLLTCEPVLTEAAFLLQREGREAEPLFVLLERGVLRVGLEVEDQLADLRALMRRYRNRPMSLADSASGTPPGARRGLWPPPGPSCSGTTCGWRS